MNRMTQPPKVGRKNGAEFARKVYYVVGAATTTLALLSIIWGLVMRVTVVPAIADAAAGVESRSISRDSLISERLVDVTAMEVTHQKDMIVVLNLLETRDAKLRAMLVAQARRDWEREQVEKRKAQNSYPFFDK